MKDTRTPSTRSPKQFKFEKEREDWSDREIQMAQLYYSRLIQDTTERTRSNTSGILWIIVIGIVMSIIAGILT